MAKDKNEKTEKKPPTVTETAKDMFNYKVLRMLLFRDMLGTCTATSIWDAHIIQKAKKEIKKANSATNKLTKALAKFVGDDIDDIKEIQEYKGIIRSLQVSVMPFDQEIATRAIPADKEEILEYGRELQEILDAAIKRCEENKKTIFMLGEDGLPIISSHMILGNLKENLRNIVNNSEKSKSITSKVSCGEIMAGDIKVIEEFLKPSEDLKRDKDGKAILEERPIHFERMGKKESAIAMSEIIPAGAIFSCHLRIRKGSPVESMLTELLHMGKNNGLGCWRGSGNKGAYYFKLEDSTYEECESVPKGWN